MAEIKTRWLSVWKTPSEPCDRALVRAMLHYRRKIKKEPSASELGRALGMNRNRVARVRAEVDRVHNDRTDAAQLLLIPESILLSKLSPEAKCLAGLIVAKSRGKGRGFCDKGERCLAEDLGVGRFVVRRAWKRILGLGLGTEWKDVDRRRRMIDPEALRSAPTRLHESAPPKCTNSHHQLHESAPVSARIRTTHKNENVRELPRSASGAFSDSKRDSTKGSISSTVLRLMQSQKWESA